MMRTQQIGAAVEVGINYMAIGETIRRFRKERRLNQRALADMLGVSMNTVSRWEKGEVVPKLFHLLDMIEIFGIELDVLVHE